MRKLALTLAALLLALLAPADPVRTPAPTPTPVAVRCFSGECFPETTPIAGADVPLAGAGTLTYLGFRVYTAALYAPPQIEAIEPALGREPVQLVLRYHREISRRDIDRSVDKAFERNPDVDVARLRNEIHLMKGFHRDVRAGDSYVLIHEPGTGLVVRFNGEELGTIPGEEFSAAYLGIWLSRRPLSESLKAKLTAGLSGKDKRAESAPRSGGQTTK